MHDINILFVTIFKSFFCSRYCNEHALRATLARNKQNSKNQPPRTAEVLLHSLSHYVKKPKTHMPSTSYSKEDRLTADENAEQNANIYNDPFGIIKKNLFRPLALYIYIFFFS